MEYRGKLYGKVGKSYFPLLQTTDDYDNLVKRVAELEALLEQKLNIHGVMQAEGSDSAKEAAVASSAVGQNGSGGHIHQWEHVGNGDYQCYYCHEYKD